MRVVYVSSMRKAAATIQISGDSAMADDDNKDAVRLSVNVSADVANTLRELATFHKTSVTEVLRKAIGTEKFFQDAAKRDAKILIEEPDKSVKQVVLR
jgi:hypothetical protein